MRFLVCKTCAVVLYIKKNSDKNFLVAFVVAFAFLLPLFCFFIPPKLSNNLPNPRKPKIPTGLPKTPHTLSHPSSLQCTNSFSNKKNSSPLSLLNCFFNKACEIFDSRGKNKIFLLGSVRLTCSFKFLYFG